MICWPSRANCLTLMCRVRGLARALDRGLGRHGVSNLNALRPKTPSKPHKAFKTYEPGFLHGDVKHLPQLPDETPRRCLFGAMDPWPGRCCKASPRGATRWVVVRILPAKTAANARRFLGDLHRACPIRIAAMVGRFAGRLSDVLTANRLDSALDLERTRMRYVHPYNTQSPQAAFKSRTPMQAMKDWHKSHPHWFLTSPHNHPRRDT